MPACIHPVCIKLPNGAPQQVACGCCVACRINRTRNWTVRCMLELEAFNYVAQFQTLTFNNDCLPSDYGLHKRDLQLYFKRLRKNLGNRRIRYFACGEYGDKFGRPHYHAIVFGLGQSVMDRLLVRKSWPFGFVGIGTAEWNSIQYVTKYIQKKWTGSKSVAVYGDREPPFQLASKSLGLVTSIKYKSILQSDECLRLQNGKIVPIPPYIKRKLDIDTSIYDIDNLIERHEKALQCIDSGNFDKLYQYEKFLLESSIQRQRNLDGKSAIALARSKL